MKFKEYYLEDKNDDSLNLYTITVYKEKVKIKKKEN
jgi:hypothetical protein